MAMQLTVGDVIDLAKALIFERGVRLEDVKKLPIYIGNDNELNGIHCAGECRIIDADDKEDECFVEMINEDRNNYELIGRDSAILIY